MMNEFNSEALTKRLKLYKERKEKELAHLEPNTPEALWAREAVLKTVLVIDELSSKFNIRPPSLTFDDCMTLDMGDITFKLIYYGEGAHTNNDILIFVPQENLLMIGDIAPQKMIPIIGRNAKIKRWLKVWGTLFENDNKIKMVVKGHGDILSGDQMKLRYKYIKDLWDGVTASFKEGLPMVDVKERLAFDTKFKYVHHLTHILRNRDCHVKNIEAVWRILNK